MLARGYPVRPTAKQHPSDAELAAFALGQLDQTSAEWISRHCDICITCRNLVEKTPRDSLIKLLRGQDANKTGPWISGTDTHSSLPPAPPIDLGDIPPSLRDHPRYRVVRKLGAGGMGTVYQAEHKMMGRLVAVKVMNRAFVGHPEAIDRFNREIKAAASLNHPNIAQAYDADQAGELQLLVMEFIHGQDLAAYLKAKGQLPIAHACYYVRQAALGLQHAHEHGLVHRDLKPQNLMRMPKGQVKILDFGLAKLLTESSDGHGLTRDRTTMGTPAYMAPEQAMDTKSADIRADIYSLGCTLFCLLTGRPPFVDGSATAMIIAHLETPPPPLESLRPDVTPELAALVARMLAKKPQDRPQTPRDVAEALTPFVKPGPAKAASQELKVAVAPVAPPAARRPRWLVPATAGGIAFALLVATVFWLKTPTGYVYVEAPDNAEVRLDGELVTVKPYRIVVDARERKLVVTKDGAEIRSDLISIKDKGRTITATLAAAPATPPSVGWPPASTNRSPDEENEPLMRWSQDYYADGRWVAQRDLYLYPNGKAGKPDSADTWTLRGNVLTVNWQRSHVVDRTIVSFGGRGRYGTNHTGLPLRGELRSKSPASAAVLASVSAAAPVPQPKEGKPELIMIWKHEAFAGKSWIVHLDALMYSNGKLDRPDGSYTWSVDGNVLTLDRSNGQIVHRMFVSDDGQEYAGSSQTGVPVRGKLRWSKAEEEANGSLRRPTGLIMVWRLDVFDTGKWIQRPAVLLTGDGRSGPDVTWAMTGRLLTAKRPDGKEVLRVTVSEDGQSFAGKNITGQPVRGTLAWKRE
jgi:hypothetical protein